MDKDDTIADVLALLRRQFGDAFDVVDHWDADRLAIGVARTGTTEPLVYVRTLERGTEPRFYVALESPPAPASDLHYTPAGEYDAVSSAQLVDIVGRHLGLRG